MVSTAAQAAPGTFPALSSEQPLDRIAPEDVERFKAAREMEYKTVKGKEKGSDLQLKNSVSRVMFLAEKNEQTRVLSFDEQAKYLAALFRCSGTWQRSCWKPGCGPKRSAGFNRRT